MTPYPARRTTLTREELDRLSLTADLREVEPGIVIFNLGEQGDRMYLIESGRVELEFGAGVPSKYVGTLGFFGELALLFGSHRRSARAIAAEPSRLWELGIDNFDALVHTDPALMISILRRSCASLLESEHSLASYLKRRNDELANALDQLQRAERQLTDAELAAQTDPLTGLYNRRYLEVAVDGAIERARRSEVGITLLLLDLDRFKEINDQHGHASGDAVLRAMAGRLRSNLRRNDLASRIGGDEIAVLILHPFGFDASPRVTDLFQRLRPFKLHDGAGAIIPVTASMGATTYRPEEDWSSFFERADRYLYRAKEAGRDRLCWNGELAATNAET